MPPSSPPTVEQARVSAYVLPTDSPESDSSLAWHANTLVLVELESNGVGGLGYCYAHVATARLIDDMLLPMIRGGDAWSIPAHTQRLTRAVRNLGQVGIAAMAVSVVDIALWDLKARLLGLPLVSLLGASREAIAAYGSGGFSSYPPDRLQRHCAAWVDMGLDRVKIKVGYRPREDGERVRLARAAIGTAALMVDADGGYGRKQAQAMADLFAREGVSWFEEPVPFDDLPGLRLMRDRTPPGMDIAAGEYTYRLDDARRLLQADAIDVLQADATRCGGITGFLATAALADAFHIPLSAHGAPGLHLSLGCAVRPACHIELFRDHLRIEERLFDGLPRPGGGLLRPDLTQVGLGLAFRHTDARPYLIACR